MKPKTVKKNEATFAGMIGAFFLISAVFFGGYVFYEDKLNLNEREEGHSEFSSTYKPSEIDIVNDHLKSVSDKMELQRMKAMVANMKVANSSSGESSNTNRVEETRPIIDFSDDPRGRQQAEDFGRTNELKKIPTDPRSLVYGSVIDERRAQKVKEFQRREQAKAFVANAKKDGWRVRLDENFKIKSYDRMNPDSEEQIEQEKFKGYEILPK